MIDDINSISNGKYVLIGIRDDGTYNLNINVYSSLETLGMQIKFLII